MTGRLRTLLRIDSAGCLALGAALAAFGGRLADTIGVESALVVRSVGVVLVSYAIALAGLARTTPGIVTMTARITAVSDAAWVVASVALVAAGVLSDRGAVIVTVLAVAVAAIGASKVLTVRSVTGGARRGRLANAT